MTTDASTPVTPPPSTKPERPEPDRWGFRPKNPTAAEVIANTRPDARDGVTSAWCARSYGCQMLVHGNVDTAGTLTWHMLVPFEAPGSVDDDKGFRSIEVFPPDDSDAVISWCWRPCDAETWEHSRWSEVYARIERGDGRALHDAMIEDVRRELGGTLLPPPVLSLATVARCRALEAALRERIGGAPKVEVKPRHDGKLRILVRYKTCSLTVEAESWGEFDVVDLAAALTRANVPETAY